MDKEGFRFLEGEFRKQLAAKEIETVRKSLEKAMFTDYGGSRIKGREQVFGPEDPEVKLHKQAEQERLRQEAARKAEQMKKDNALAPASHDFRQANKPPAPSQEPPNRSVGRGR
jgi:hypothetical protein